MYQHYHYPIRRVIVSTIFALLIFSCAFFLWVSYPASYAPQEVFLAEGTVPVEIAGKLEATGVVRSAFVLRVVLKLRGTAGALVPGNYLFEERESVYKIASRITRGGFAMEQKKVTIPEGSTNKQVANAIVEVFPSFDSKQFLLEAEGKQGYLFPETYYLLSTSTEKMLTKLTDSFDYHVRKLQSEVLTEGKEWNDIVKMASILEEEAKTPEDFKIISGILWKRLSIGMALQVDVSKWTYENRGLPPEPISNPGLITLEAALYPTETKYLYYLTGNDDLMHYATTFEEHKVNIAKYLR